jgi:cyanophycinase
MSERQVPAPTGPPPGPVALVGSGEYLPVMLDVEAALLAGRPPRYVQLPTAAAEEGAASVDRWVSLGAAQAARLGVEAVPLLALDRTSADAEANARLVAGAGLIYLSGGNPPYLAATLSGTRVWAAILEAWRGGAALAGCSAGAIALTAWVPDLRRPLDEPRKGLGVVAALAVLPHFDRLGRWAPGLADAMAARAPAGMTLVGIDEETAIVSHDADLRRWWVRGRQAAWVLTPDGRRPFPAGEEIVL